MAKNAVFWLNAFPHQKGIGRGKSPRAIITGVGVDYHRHCKYQFGEYVQTHKEHDNTMAPRTIGALALRPTGNAQGSYQFFSLSTRRILTQNRATTLPMPDDVIEQVHRIARRQKAHAGMVFENRNRVRVEEFYDNDEDSEMDEEYVPDSDDESSAQYDTDDEVDNTDDEVSQDAPEGAHEVPDIAGVDPEDEIEDANVEDVKNDNGLDGDNDDNNDDENYYANAASERRIQKAKEKKMKKTLMAVKLQEWTMIMRRLRKKSTTVKIMITESRLRRKSWIINTEKGVEDMN